MKNCKIIAIGDNVCDKYLSRGKMYPGGQCVNTCVYVKMNKTESAYLGKYGDDEVAECVQNTLRKIGIDDSHCRKYHGENEIDMTTISNEERKGLRAALVVMIVFVIIMAICTIPENGVFRENGSLKAWTSSGLIASMMLFFLLPGIAYGYVAGTLKSDKDVATLISKALAGMGGYMAIVFTASQFIAYFGYTNLGTVIAVTGADTLKTIGFTGLPLIVGFVFLTGFINLFMGSASAKWAIMAPVFVPMLMQLGYTPEFTQLAYRIGDSSTNIISPLMSYFAMAVAFMQKYKKDGGMGTLISLMLPYSICFLIGWTILMVVWFILGLPLGPGVGIHL